MKVINRADFRLKPSGTLFRKYKGSCFGELEVKDCNPSSIGNDFVSSDFTTVDGEHDIYTSVGMFIAIEGGKEFKFIYDCIGWDGMLEGDQLFAVYDADDIKKLTDALLGLIPKLPEKEFPKERRHSIIIPISEINEIKDNAHNIIIKTDKCDHKGFTLEFDHERNVCYLFSDLINKQ